MAKRITPYLRRRVLDLPLADRLALFVELRASIQVVPADHGSRLAYLADKMQDASGVNVREARDRTVAAVWPRNIFIFVARREGFSQSTIGRVIGRDHSSVCAAERRVSDAFASPSQYKNEIRLYNKFVDSL